MSQLEILTPYLVEKIWGGTFLNKIKGIALGSEPLGESWEVSCLPSGPSQVESGSLHKLIDQKQMPYLVKFIDTSDNLSVQVHPDDNYAQVNEGKEGKSECWLILDAQEGAGIYLGFKSDMKKNNFVDAINSGADLRPFMKFHPVKKGDFFYVPAGSIHAIGKGVLLAEVQQNSDVTYRVWDWNRVDANGNSRELHVKQALDVLNFENSKNSDDYFQMQRGTLNAPSHQIFSHRDFDVYLYNLSRGERIKVEAEVERKRSVVCLTGRIGLAEQESPVIESYTSALAFGSKSFTLEAQEASKFLVIR